MRSTGVSSANVFYTAGITLAQYENINLLNAPIESEFSESLRGTFSLVENTADLVANINTVAEVVNYSRNQLSDRQTGQLRANALWIIKPQQLEWYISDIFRQTAIDSFLNDSVSNQQDANVFSMGPNYYIHISSRSNINIEGRMQRSSFENFVNNDQYTAITRWSYDINAATNMKLNYELGKVDFQSEDNSSDYRRNDTYFSLRYQRALNTLEMEAGITRLNNDLIGEVAESRYRLSLQNERTKTSNVRIYYENVLSDTSRQLLQTVRNGANSLDTTSRDTFLNKTASLSYNKNTSYGSLQVTVNNTRRLYTNQLSLNRELSGFILRNNWDLIKSSSLTFIFTYRSTLFEDPSINRKDRDYAYNLSYKYSARRNMNVIVNAITQKRESTVQSSSYDDARLLITLEFLSR